MWSLSNPTDAKLDSLLTSESNRDFTYSCVGATAKSEHPIGFDLDENRAVLGHGERAFEAACSALRRWQQFPPNWTRIYPESAPIRPSQTIIVVIRSLGIWWINSARIVYVIDEPGPPRQFGFAYGTLPAHVECGEERFMIEMAADGAVSYMLRAISKPRILATRLGYPIVRGLQKRFVRASQAAMSTAVRQTLSRSEQAGK
jgi:uncharacterized protein (UPF0548 family)